MKDGQRDAHMVSYSKWGHLNFSIKIDGNSPYFYRRGAKSAKF